MIVNITRDYVHLGPTMITDLENYREIEVKPCDPDMIGAQPKCCIDNSRELADYGDLLCVKGYYSFDGKIGLFHYWNLCPQTGTYWDSTPCDEPMRYYVEAE